MSLVKNLSLDRLSFNDKKALILELRNSLKQDKVAIKALKEQDKAAKQAARANKRAARIAALEAKIEALRNPVGAKAMKANKRPSKATIITA